MELSNFSIQCMQKVYIILLVLFALIFPQSVQAKEVTVKATVVQFHRAEVFTNASCGALKALTERRHTIKTDFQEIDENSECYITLYGHDNPETKEEKYSETLLGGQKAIDMLNIYQDNTVVEKESNFLTKVVTLFSRLVKVLVPEIN